MKIYFQKVGIFGVIFLFTLFCQDTFAQVGIGTTNPDISTILDISSDEKGVSFPNINLNSETDATTIVSPKVGLMVFNTNGTMPCGKGLYFNNGTVASPIWTCFSKTTKQYHVFDNAGRSSVTSSTHTLQPNCKIDFTVPTGQTVNVKIDASVGIINTSTNRNDYSILEAVIYVDGSPLPRGGWLRTTVGNVGSNLLSSNSLSYFTLSTVWSNVSSGTHTIELHTARWGGNTSINIGGNCLLDTNCGELNAIVTYN